jgi:cyanate permease
VIGRVLTGLVIDRVNRRLATTITLMVQMGGLGFLAWPPAGAVVYAGCALFVLGVGNMTTLPGLILAVKWPRERFSALVGLVVAINQFTFALGPVLVGVIHDASGTYGPALSACVALQAVAAVVVLAGRG